MRKIILGLAVVAMAAATSAFTSKKVMNEINLDSYYYGYSLNEEQYLKIEGIPDPENCTAEGERCVVESPTDLGPELSVMDAQSLNEVGNKPDSHYFN